MVHNVSKQIFLGIHRIAARVGAAPINAPEGNCVYFCAQIE